MKILVMRQTEFASAEDVLRHIGEELEFPSYYGCNLDALFDCLGDVNSPVQFAFVYDGCDAADPFASVIRVIDDAALENGNIVRLDEIEQD